MTNERNAIMKEETKKQSTELATMEAKPTAAPTPFGFMRRFATDMERLFEDFEGFRFPSLFGREFFPFTREFERVAWSPEIEVRQNNGEFMVRADLPGLKKDEVKVELTNEMLTISGERKEEKEEKGEGFYRSERNYGRFYRQIALPEGSKADEANATFANGVLEVKIPVTKTESQARKLEINEAPEKQIKAAA